MKRRRRWGPREQVRLDQDTEELLHELGDPVRWCRADLQQYLEARGFAVYDSEDTETLREAVRQDLAEDTVPWEVEDD
jgi:hypothetical protein